MSTKAYYPLNEIGAGKVGFSKTRSIIEAAFYGNNVVKVNTLKEAYNLAKNSPGTIVTDMPVYRGEEFGLDSDVAVFLFGIDVFNCTFHVDFSFDGDVLKKNARTELLVLL